MYFEASYPLRPGYLGELTSPLLRPTLRRCRLRFWYHMWGSGMGTLRVSLQASARGSPGEQLGTVFTVNGNQGNQWKQATVALNSNGRPFFVVFQAERGRSYSSDIAIDDVEFLDCTDGE